MVRQLSAAFLLVGFGSVGLLACENTPATPQVAITADLRQQGSTPAGFDSCPTFGTGGSWMRIGEFRGPTKDETSVVVDGADQNGANVSIECSVAPGGKGFMVDLTAELAGAEGGSVRIQGDFSTSGEQTGVNAVFQRGDFGQFSASDCTVTYYNTETEDESKASFRGVAAGRVWGFLRCGATVNASSKKACFATAQFRFENCGKE